MVAACSSSTTGNSGGTSTDSNDNAHDKDNDDASVDGGSQNANGDDGSVGTTATTTHVSIGFDELASCTAVTTQYPSVTFSGSATSTTMASDINDVGQSMPNFLGSVTGGECDGDYENEFHMAFTNAVDNLHFDAVGVDGDATSTSATINITYDDGKTASMPLHGNGNDQSAVPFDLSTYASIMQVDIVQVTDIGGIGLDNFAFDVTK
jgi:hypothetical protein